jgi:hypothetical protein
MLKHIGFPIYAILDDVTGRYLGLYVVPDNRDVDFVTLTLSRNEALRLTVSIFVHSLTALLGIPMQDS